MDNAEYHPKLLPLILERGLLEEDPFVLVDVGCGMGPDPLWRLFGEALHVYGFDANVEEIERLAAIEENPNVRYRAALVGLPEGHEFLARQAAERDDPASGYFDFWDRTSTMRTLRRVWSEGERSLAEANAWAQHRLATEKVALDEFVAAEAIGSVDFVKVDTDGADLEVLVSAERMLDEAAVLGLLVETPFMGAATDTANTFHNVDRLLKRHGFVLYSLSVNRYSRAALPAPFAYSMYAQTEWGQAMWGDSLYLRDAAAPAYDAAGGPDLSPAKLLKLLCLYELFRLPDCAAELLLVHRETLAELLDVEEALNVLTPSEHEDVGGYADYVASFDADPASFFPQAGDVAESGQTEEIAPAAEGAPDESVAAAARVFAYRLTVAVWWRTPELVRAPLRRILRRPVPDA